MNQGIEDSLAAVMPAAVESGLMTSLCTITAPSGTFNDAGSPEPVDYIPVDGLSLIPCTTPPLTYGPNLQPTELKSLEEILSKNMLHVLLAGYYPQIIQSYQAIIGKSDGDGGIADPESYDIVGVEWDSQNRMTRLAVQLATI